MLHPKLSHEHVWESEAWFHSLASSPPETLVGLKSLSCHKEVAFEGNQDESMLLSGSDVASPPPLALFWVLICF